jgi:hypothetical protein
MNIKKPPTHRRAFSITAWAEVENNSKSTIEIDSNCSSAGSRLVVVRDPMVESNAW